MRIWLSLGILILGWAAAVGAPPKIATIKVSTGAAWIERAGEKVTAQIGVAIQTADVLATGPSGALGVTFSDDSLLAIGPSSALGIGRYTYDPVTRVGKFESTLLRGTMSASTGRMARESPDAVTIKTPKSTIKVTGTTIAIRAGDQGTQ